MRASRARCVALAALAVLAGAALLAAGCAREEAPPPIADGAVCANCGMTAGNRRFACEQRVDGRWRVYDSIECLAGDRDAAQHLAAARAAASGRRARVYLADYDSRTLHAADSLHVVHGAFSSPMGGGYAAFLDPAAADSLAALTRGSVVSLADVRRATQAEARAEAQAEARP